MYLHLLNHFLDFNKLEIGSPSIRLLLFLDLSFIQLRSFYFNIILLNVQNTFLGTHLRECLS
jgi:hypothetical protein